MKIAIITDTNSGITNEEAKQLGIELINMPFFADGVEYIEGVTCTYERFFEMLSAGADVSTSQPSPATLTDAWDKALEENDAVIHIPMSSGLSSSCETAKGLAQAYDGKVFVVDNKRISITQRQSVLDALKLVELGYTAEKIHEELEKRSFDCSIYLAVNTLELLKKSGRVTAAGAALASVLNLKPVLQIQGAKLDAFAKARGMANAEAVMLKAIRTDLDTRFKGKNVIIQTAYSGDYAPAAEWLEKVKKEFPGYRIELYQLPISICCHVSAGVKAVGCIEYV